MQLQARRWRFGTALLACFLVSLIVLVLFSALSTTPGEADAQRRAPRLDPPSVRVVPADGTSAYVVPVLALHEAGSGVLEVHPVGAADPVPVRVLERRDGTAVITADGLSSSSRVLLRRYDEHADG